MSDLDRILKLSGLVQGNGFKAPVQEGKMSDLDIEAQEMTRDEFIEAHSGTLGGAEAAGKFWDDSKESNEESNEGVETEAVGSFADPILDLCDEVGCDPDHPVLADLIRYLDGDTIADFVKEFRSNHEYDNGMEYESTETEDYDSKPGEEIAHASQTRKSKKLPYKDWGKTGDPKDDRYRIPKIETVQEAEGMKTIEVNKDIQLAGDSIWDRDEADANPDMVHVKSCSISEDEEGYLSVEVEHDGPWKIYTDTAFPEAISEICGMELDWSEQGMQDDGMAHLEGEIMEAYESISETFHTELMRELKD